MSRLALEIVEGPGAGRRVFLDAPLDIGRDPNASFPLDDRLVSRHHARVSAADGAAILEDLGSLNGTLVDGTAILGPTKIEPGSQFSVGVTVFEVRDEEQIAERPSAVQPIPPVLATALRAPDYLPSQLVKQQVSSLDPLLDSRVKRRANAAPIAIFALAVIILLLFIATKS